MIKFPVLKGKPPINILQRLENYRDTAIGYNTVKKWVSKTKGEEENPSMSDTQEAPNKLATASLVGIHKLSWNPPGTNFCEV